jgi:hypothetical protein
MKLRWLKIRQKLTLCQGHFLPIFYLLPMAHNVPNSGSPGITPILAEIEILSTIFKSLDFQGK